MACLLKLQFICEDPSLGVKECDKAKCAPTNHLLLSGYGKHLVDGARGLDDVSLLGCGPLGIINLDLVCPANH